MEEYRSPLETRLKEWHGEEWHTSRGRIIRDIVYAVDTGLITTVAFLAGVSVSLPNREQVLLAGFIEVVSGTLAIFFGAFLSARAQRHFFENQMERERREIVEDPEKEKEEIRVIFREMGFQEDEVEIAVTRISANHERWFKFMVQEEIGISPGVIDDPLQIGAISAASFVVGAAPAIAPFFFGDSVNSSLMVSAGFVLTFLFILGVWKTRITKAHWLASGLETLAIGAVSCGAGFLLGRYAAMLAH